MDSFGPLRQLIALAETGNFRKAGERLGVTHSAISQSLNRLESEYGVELFSRQRNKAVPTAFGQRLIEGATATLKEMDHAARDIQLMRNLEGGRLIIGVDPNIGETLLAPALGRLMNSHPMLKFTVDICGWDEIEETLRNGRADLYVGLAPDRRAMGISYRKLKLLPPTVACSSQHPLAGQNPADLHELLKYPIIGGSAPDWFFEKINEVYPGEFESIEAMRSIFLTTQDLGLLRNLLLTTNAIALVSKSLIGKELESGALCLLNMEPFPFDSVIPGVIAYVEGRPLPPSASRLFSEIELFLDQAWQRLEQLPSAPCKNR